VDFFGTCPVCGASGKIDFRRPLWKIIVHKLKNAGISALR